MTPGEFREIVKTMREFGVSHVKMAGLELSMGKPSIEGLSVPPEAPASDSDPIKHKIEQMTSILKMSDNELVDQLFPDTQSTEEESA